MIQIPNHNVYITTQQFNKFKEENFKESLKQAHLVCKNGFHSKLISFNEKLSQIKENIQRFKRN